MHKHPLRVGLRSGILLGALLTAALPAQQDPSCVAPFSPTTLRAEEPVRPLWGGETRHVFSRRVAGDEHTWVVGDGGFIRHRKAGGAFEIQGTPPDARFSLHDIYFLPDGSRGWATGNGGRVLMTKDLGATWELLPPTLPGCAGNPATIWRVRFLDELRGFVCGLHMFCVTVDGGLNWTPVTLANGNASVIEFYALEVLGDLNGFVAVAAGQPWTGHCSSAGPGTAQIFRLTGSGVAAVTGAWADAAVTLPPGVDMCEDPWDIGFEPNPASPQTATGWLCGGTGSAQGLILKTSDSGANWTYDFGGPNSGFNTCYGIAVRSATEAVAVGYGGVVQWRDPNGVWRTRKYKDPNGVAFTGPLGDAAWTEGANATCVIAGSWGFLRQRSDFSLLIPLDDAWTDLQPASALSNSSQGRFFDVAFRNDLSGFVVGQNGDLRSTDDGGCSLQAATFAAGSVPPMETLVAVDYSNSKHYAIAVGVNQTNSPNVVYNPDANTPGTPWVRYAGTGLPNSASFVDVDFLVGQVAWAIGSQTPNTNGNPHLLARTDDGGASWQSFVPAFDFAFVPTGLVGIGASEGLVVGSIGTPPVPAAYEVLIANNLVMVQPVACPAGLAGALHDVAGRGDSLAVCDVVAVGGRSDEFSGEGYVLKYVPGSATTSSMFALEGPAATIEYTTVAMAGGGFAVVGMRQRASVRHADSFGKLLVRSTGVNPTWSWTRSRTNKTLRAIRVTSTLRAWLLAKAEGEDVSGEFATVNDSTLLLWDPQ